MKNSRIATCRGCQARQSGLKSRIAIPHTCGMESKSSRVGAYSKFEAMLDKPPLPITCPKCHGSGEIVYSIYETGICQKCLGSGEII